MFTSLVILLTFCLVFDRSYHVLWFKIQKLFDILPSSSLTIEEIGSADIISLSGSNDSLLHKFYSEYSLSSKRIYKSVRILFSITFAAYVVAIEIVLWQIKAADSGEDGNFVTTVMWPSLLGLFFVSLIIVQPFLMLLFLLNKFFEDRVSMRKLAPAAIAISFTWLTLMYFLTVGPFGYTHNLLTKVSVIGVCVMGILSGLASVSTPYYAFQCFKNRNRRDMKHATHNKVETLWFKTSAIRDRIREYEECVEKSISLLKTLSTSSNQADISTAIKLKEGIAWYQLEIVKLNGTLQESKNVRLLKQLFQLIFLVYCFYKLTHVWFVAVPKLIIHSYKFPSDSSYEFFDNQTNEKDPLAITIANTLNFLILRLAHQNDLDSLIKQISLTLSVSLFACSISTVTTTISYLLTLLPIKLQILALSAMQSSSRSLELPKSRKDLYDAKKPPSIIKNLAVCELTGIYILSTILMIRSNLPTDVSSKVNQLLGERFTIPNVVIDVWSDKTFAFSSLLTIIGIKVAERTLHKQFS
ncbi:unnamed protein product [Kluyveromyces dobzhanskii CBS 2104]|uniref:WGS project CCBQ000000000 data, contig 00102 n=1 Tax=Kluyveromyces dobzhanskii CBS 2104 TaxID=1427455 RepID=A0A0A8L6W1_9SACH|nr:unnamed protein product [Kluyveromyces dobzhanskii CBS 2104]